MIGNTPYEQLEETCTHVFMRNVYRQLERKVSYKLTCAYSLNARTEFDCCFCSKFDLCVLNFRMHSLEREFWYEARQTSMD